MTHDPVLDPASDTTGAELTRLASLYEFPDFVKNAAIDDILQPGELVSNAFADEVNRKFACHTPAATWLSQLYFEEHKDQLQPAQRAHIENRLQKFAQLFGIENERTVVQEKVAMNRRVEDIPDSDYAYVWDDPENGVQKFYPLRNPQEIKAAADWLFSVRDRMIYADRQKVAARVLEKAGSAAIGLPEDTLEFLDKQAGNGIPDVDQLTLAIRYRAALAKDAQLRTEIEKMAELVLQVPQLLATTVNMVEFASTLETIDHALGIRGRYSENLARPEDVLFSHTHRKIAADVATLCPLQSGSLYEHAQFEKLSRDTIVADFGEAVARQVCRGLEVDGAEFAKFAANLPHLQARRVEEMLAEIGQHSQMRKSGGSLSLPVSELTQLAEQYARSLPPDLRLHA